ELQAGVQSGKYQYDPRAAAACVERIRDRCWLSSGDLLDACPSAFSGTAAVGDPCALEADCAGDAYCTGHFLTCGVCTARTPLGSECPPEGTPTCQGQGNAESITCAGEEGIRGIGPDGFVISGPKTYCMQVVVSVGGEGALCDVSTIAGMTQTRSVCGPGLRCVFHLETEQSVCEALPNEGESCNWGDLCEPGTGCWIDVNREGTCRPYTVQSEGEPCRGGPQNCTSQPDGTLLCDPVEDLRCAETLVCIDGTCTPRPGEGDPCEVSEFLPNGWCQNGLVCLEAELFCSQRLSEGQACSRQHECTSGYCNRGVCDPPRCDIP
ncbi:MAG TPA: hypothetical protein VHO25_05130, partial [Polyangiaceae bacterium]|nr:hypothetical protein [Polyangiaceae bacterium]